MASIIKGLSIGQGIIENIIRGPGISQNIVYGIMKGPGIGQGIIEDPGTTQGIIEDTAIFLCGLGYTNVKEQKNWCKMGNQEPTWGDKVSLLSEEKQY